MDTDELKSLLYGSVSESILNLDLRIAKSWCLSKTAGGFGLRPSMFLAYVLFKNEQAKHRGDEEFYLLSNEFVHLTHFEVHAVRRYAKQFADAGYYHIEKRHVKYMNMTNVMFYIPTDQIPSIPTEDFWRIPIKLIRPAEVGGLGVLAGSILAIVMGLYITTKREEIKISNTKFVTILAAKKPLVLKSIESLEQNGLVKKTARGVVPIMETCVSYLQNLDRLCLEMTKDGLKSCQKQVQEAGKW